MVANVLFSAGLILLGFFWNHFINFDIFLPTIAYMLYRQHRQFARSAVWAAGLYGAMGSLLWFRSLMPTIQSTAWIVMGILSANYVIARHSSSWLARLAAVVIYDNVASLPMYIMAYHTGGILGVWLQILSGIPFTLRHLVSFVALFYGWQIAITRWEKYNGKKFSPALSRK
jgi:hypothetical protein